MSGKNYILVIDQGTTGSTALLFGDDGEVMSRAYREIHQIYPQPGWVEQSPAELVDNSVAVLKEAIQKAGVSLKQIKGLGITNQRETTVLWERKTGRPVYNAIVWQCRRTAAMCEELKQRISAETVRDKTGLTIDAYFSATKLRWLLDN
ncbi:MAG: FGGY family carbohydrate kinase, partial [Dehalococcoidales bacterium]|nr:FGGY family carbohydrate kinase [Dehalococcoidales bacterium]